MGATSSWLQIPEMRAGWTIPGAYMRNGTRYDAAVSGHSLKPPMWSATKYKDSVFEIGSGARLCNEAANRPVGVPDGIDLVVERGGGRFRGDFTRQGFHSSWWKESVRSVAKKGLSLHF